MAHFYTLTANCQVSFSPNARILGSLLKIVEYSCATRWQLSVTCNRSLDWTVLLSKLKNHSGRCDLMSWMWTLATIGCTMIWRDCDMLAFVS